MGIRILLFLAVLGIVQCKLLPTNCKAIKAFVDGHNSRRFDLAEGKVPGQPAGKDLKFMMWDPELAAKAAKWASQNDYRHNPDRTIGSGRFKTGENIYQFSTTADEYDFDPDMAMDSWFKEYKDYSYGKLKSSDFGSGPDIGHYTQMAWANTNRVGCATSNYKKGKWNNFYVVCNYGPAGNFIGEAPYDATNNGKRTMSCAPGDDCDHPYGKSC